MSDVSEKYERALATQYKNAEGHFLQTAKMIGALLAKGDATNAKLKFSAYVKLYGLAMWEQLALSDLATLEKLMVNGTNTSTED
jgi:hypothetical protein